MLQIPAEFTTMSTAPKAATHRSTIFLGRRRRDVDLEDLGFAPLDLDEATGLAAVVHDGRDEKVRTRLRKGKRERLT